MMLADMPRYDYKKKGDKNEKATLQPDQVKGFNSLNEIEKYID